MERAALKTWCSLHASRVDAEGGEYATFFSRYGVVVVVVVVEDEVALTTAPPPPVARVVEVGAEVVVVVFFLVVVVTGQPLHPLVPLFLGSTPTAKSASTKTATATAPKMILRRRFPARSPVDPVDRSVEVMVSSVRSMCCELYAVCLLVLFRSATYSVGRLR